MEWHHCGIAQTKHASRKWQKQRNMAIVMHFCQVLCKSLTCSSRVVRTTAKNYYWNLSWCHQIHVTNFVHVIKPTLASRFTLAFVDPCAGPATWFCLNTLSFIPEGKEQDMNTTSLSEHKYRRHLFLAWFSIESTFPARAPFKKPLPTCQLPVGDNAVGAMQ